MIEGEPGVGKSRLGFEFVRSVEGTLGQFFEAAGGSYGRTTPFGVLIQLVRAGLDVEEG